jgi:hypothetical protein
MTVLAPASPGTSRNRSDRLSLNAPVLLAPFLRQERSTNADRAFPAGPLLQQERRLSINH